MLGKDFITRYRDIIYQETGKWLMPAADPDRKLQPRSVQLVLSTNRNLECYGYTMSESLMSSLASLPEDELVKECQILMKTVKENSQTETFQNAAVFYPDFPNQVMKLDEMEHYIYQMSEYLGVYLFGASMRPEFEPTERTPLIETFERKLKVIDTCNEYAVHELMRDRMFSTATLSESKMKTLLDYMHNTNRWAHWIYHQDIPNRENKAAIAFDIAKNRNVSEPARNELLHKLLTEATDVLRLAAELSNGKTHTVKKKMRVYVWDPKKGENIRDRRMEWRVKRVPMPIENKPGLSGKVYFKLSRPETRLVNRLLNDSQDLFTAIWLRKDLFKTFSKSVQVDSSLLRLQKAYNNLYSGNKVNEFGIPIVSPYAVIQKALDSVRSGSEDALTLTEKAAHDFPGVFSRNFIQFAVAGINHDQLQNICDIYAENAYKVPVREQLKLYRLIDLYEKGLPYRAIHIAKMGRFVKEDTTYPFAADQAQIMKDSIMASVQKQIQDHNDLGLVYIDPDIRKMKLPENGERSSSKGGTLTSGSIIDGNKDCNIIRQFIGWENQGSERIDIDTSASFYDENLEHIAECSYYNHKAYFIDKETDLVEMAVHGGDITDAPVFSAEYMDIDKKKCKEAGVKYIVLTVNSFCDIPFNKLDVVKFGFMQRQGNLDMNLKTKNWNAFNGQIFEPSTVETIIDLNSAATTTIPLIYDVEKDAFIWVDKPLEHAYGLQNTANVEYMDATKALIHRYCNNYTPSLMDLMTAYIAAGKAVEVADPKEADTIFTLYPDHYMDLQLNKNTQIISASDVDYIASELMSFGSDQKESLDRDTDGNHLQLPDDLDSYDQDPGDITN